MMEPFNSPIEVGMRACAIFEAIDPLLCDIETICGLEYLVVHTGDIPGGPESLHLNTPGHTGELQVRRQMVQSALSIGVHKGLVSITYQKDGVFYGCGPRATMFLGAIDSPYVKKLRSYAHWLACQVAPEIQRETARLVRLISPDFEHEFAMRGPGSYPNGVVL